MKPDLSDGLILAGTLMLAAGLWLLLPPGAVLAILGAALTLAGVGLARPARKDA